MITKHGRREIHEVRKGLWAFFVDCAFRGADWLRVRCFCGVSINIIIAYC